MKKLLLALGAILAMSTANAKADVIFNSSLAGGFAYTETRPSSFNYAAVLQFSQNVTVSELGVYTSVDNAQNIKFLIFSSGVSGGAESLLLSDTKSFAQNSAQPFIYSDPIDFPFLAGHTYDVGILGSSGSITGKYVPGNYTQDGVTEISRNANFNNYNAPTTGQYSGVSPFVELVSGPTSVPEPASVTVLAAGLIGLLAFARRARYAQQGR